jgi:hypothetical protein
MWEHIGQTALESMTKDEGQRRTQELLAQAEKLVREAQDIGEHFGFDLNFLGARYDSGDEMWSVTRFKKTVEWSSSSFCIEDLGPDDFKRLMEGKRP